MTKGFLAFSLLGFVGLLNGCTTFADSDVLFPEDKGAKIVTTNSQFDEMAEHSEKYVGQETKLAGAVVSIDQTAEGYLVLAKWLPYPKSNVDQPLQNGQLDEGRHFLIRFVGKQEKVFYTTHGNKFLLEGKVEGTKTALVNVFGPRKNLLYVNAKCVKIWETGEDDDSSSQRDVEYPPTRQRTVCAN
ncbi:MAG: Slp family lipoprotein [Nitrospirota bacterium]